MVQLGVALYRGKKEPIDSAYSIPCQCMALRGVEPRNQQLRQVIVKYSSFNTRRVNDAMQPNFNIPPII